METTPRTELRRRSLSVISISSGDDTSPPPSKRKRSANTTPQPDTPSKKLVMSIDGMALMDEDLQIMNHSPEKTQQEIPGDVSFPPIETYRLKSANILRMLYADEAPPTPRIDTTSSETSPGISAVALSPKCYWYPDGQGYTSLSDGKNEKDHEAAGGIFQPPEKFMQPTVEKSSKTDILKDRQPFHPIEV